MVHKQKGYGRETWGGNMDSIYLAVEGDKWQALVNRLMNLHILYNVGNLLTEELLASQGFCTTELVIQNTAVIRNHLKFCKYKTLSQ